MSRPKRILIVDDEPEIRDMLKEIVEGQGHEAELAADGFEALAKLQLGIDLVLLDLVMPGMDGYEVARRIRQDPDGGVVPIIMVTALTGREDRLRAVEAGANDFIAKPADVVEVRVRMASLLKMKEAHDALTRHQQELENEVQARTAALRRALADMTDAQRRTQQAYLETLHGLALAAEYKDAGTGAHIQRVSGYATLLARYLHLPPHEVELVRMASPLHDVGKIGIPEAILLKPGALTAQERATMETHAQIGSRLLSSLSGEVLQAAGVIALSHHERWNGTGYPHGLAGERIPLWGRICAVADVFDALTTERSYKKAFSNEQAVEILQKERGQHFDPALIDLFLNQFAEAVAIQAQYRQK